MMRSIPVIFVACVFASCSSQELVKRSTDLNGSDQQARPETDTEQNPNSETDLGPGSGEDLDLDVEFHEGDANSIPQEIPPKEISLTSPQTIKHDFGFTELSALNKKHLKIRVVNNTNETIKGVYFKNANPKNFPFSNHGPGSCREVGENGSKKLIPLTLKPGEPCTQLLYFRPIAGQTTFVRKGSIYAAAEGLEDLLVASPTGSTEVKVVKATVLSNVPGQPGNYRTVWTGNNPASFVNPVKQDAVLSRMIVRSLNRTAVFVSHGVKKAAMDVCIYVYPPIRGLPIVLFNTSEVLCYNQALLNGPGWPKPTWDISFPGQGQLVKSNDIILCGTHTIVMEAASMPPGVITDFSCEMYFRPIGWKPQGKIVQSIRFPYIDEQFTGVAGRLTHHTNFGQRPLNLIANWTYFSSWNPQTGSDVSMEGRFIIKGAGGTVDSWIQPLHTGRAGSVFSPAHFKNIGKTLKPGQRFGGACKTFGGEGYKKDCAFYVFVERATDPTRKIGIKETLSQADINEYCFSSLMPVPYSFTAVPGANVICRDIFGAKP